MSLAPFLSSLSNLIFSSPLQHILSNLIQLYFFTTSLLYLITFILHIFNFYYSTFLLNNFKIFSIFNIAIFGLLKNYVVYQNWMLYVGIVVGGYLSVYFYDSVSTMVEKKIEGREDTHTSGVVIVVMNVIMTAVVHYAKYKLKIHPQSFYTYHPLTHQHIYIILIIFLFIFNFFSSKHKTIFPFLLILFILLSTQLLQLLFISYNIFPTIPLHLILILMLIIDAEGRQCQTIKNKSVHYVFMISVHFFIFVVMNENVKIEYILLFGCLAMMMIGK